LRPIERKSDEARLSANVEILHLYLPTGAFARLMDDYNLPAVPGRSIRYTCGLQDELINQIGLSVLSEMTCPTAAGRMLVETSHAHVQSSASPLSCLIELS
jgi:AraC family transcriptional regulator